MNFIKKNFLPKENIDKKPKTKNYKIGIIFGVFVGIIFGIIPVITILNNTQIFENLNLQGSDFIGVNAMNSIARGASISAFNDLWTFLLNGLLLFALAGTYKNWEKVKNLAKTKAGLYALLGGLFGGPLGNTFFFAVFILMTPSIGSVFYVLEMILSGIVGVVLFKRSMGKRSWYGIGVIATSVMIMLIVQTIAIGGSSSNILAGSILGILAVSSYTTESLLLDRAVSINKIKGINAFHFLQLKAISSSLFGFLILIPLTSSIFSFMFTNAYPAAITDPSNSLVLNYINNLGGINNITATLGYGAFANLFTSISFPIAFGGSMLLFLGRIAFYNSISRIGSTLTNTLFQNQVIVTPIAGGILFGISLALGENSSFGGGSSIYTSISQENQVWFQPIFWILAIIILISAIYVSLNKNPINRVQENNMIIKKALEKNKLKNLKN